LDDWLTTGIQNDINVQNSDAWLEWRRGGIGASDLPVIMQKVDWSTPYQLSTSKKIQPRAKRRAMLEFA
jgi:predicted phage-related endonuclease